VITIDGNQKIVESYEEKMLSIGFFTAQVRQLFERTNGFKALEPNDFDAHWEN
jgi:hypothetical protein